jgi:hypothetical protein
MSRSNDTLSTLINRVELYDLQLYLTRNGWSKVAQNGRKWQLFVMPSDDSDGLRIMLPASDKYIDSNDRITQAIEALSQIEGRSVLDICVDLLSTTSDSLRVRLQIPDTKTSIPIENASKHVKAIKNLLLYSACSEIKTLPHFEHPIPTAQGMLTSFEFCHTFQGSFGFEISSSVVKENATADFFEPPANRKIVERIVSATPTTPCRPSQF